MVRRNAIRSNIRRGRFFSNNVSGANAITIIKPVNGKRYRVFNSGGNAFRVIWGAGGRQALVRPKSSLDFAAANADVRITTATAKPVKGSYDVVDGSDQPRNGRFRFPGAGGTIKPIVRSVGIYRIFNSHDQSPFAISLDGGTTNLVSLKPGSSIDIQVNDTETLQVTAVGPSSGSYQLVSESDGRTGKISGSTKIVHGLTADRRYRVFNSGESSFDVNYGDGAVELGAGCSIDARINGSEVSVTTGNGFYEVLALIAESQSGRCTFEAATAGETRRVIGRARPRFYRVLNSGDDDLQVMVGTTALDVKPGMSIDFVPAMDGNVEIKSTAASQLVESIYDELNRNLSVKSGRFFGTIATTAPLTIVDVAQGAGAAATYRFLNSGDHPFQVFVNGAAQCGTGGLLPGQSFDLKVAVGPNLNVSVSRITDTGDPEINGIYEYVNRGS